VRTSAAIPSRFGLHGREVDLREAATASRELMDRHGLTSWHFKFDNAKVRFGSCNYETHTISISRHLTMLNTWENVANTVLHEIAHALAGKPAGHGRSWKLHANAIGCTAERCYDPDVVIAPPTKFVGTCPSCKRTAKRHRRNRVACATCCATYNNGRFDSRYLLTWTKVDP
jgi:predicted SprT family Zn-dependent metalloprotease